MNPNNIEWMQYLNGINIASKPQYERTVKRYNYFCVLEQIEPSAIESVGKYINFLHFRVPKDGVPLEEYCVEFMPQVQIMTSSIWSMLSHLKKYFQLCLRRNICDEDLSLNTTLQNWEKKDTKTQSKEFNKEEIETFLTTVPMDDPEWWPVIASVIIGLYGLLRLSENLNFEFEYVPTITNDVN